MRLRADGMESHLTELAHIGLGQTDVDAGRALASQLEVLDAEQEALKARKCKRLRKSNLTSNPVSAIIAQSFARSG